MHLTREQWCDVVTRSFGSTQGPVAVSLRVQGYELFLPKKRKFLLLEPFSPPGRTSLSGIFFYLV